MTKPLRKMIVAGVSVAALSGAGWAGWSWWTEARHFETTDNAYIHSDISVVSPNVAGIVRGVAVVDNQHVRAGDVLVVLDDEDYRARAAQAEAAVAEQQAALASNGRKLELQRTLIRQAEAGVAAAEAELSRADQEYARVQQLTGSNWASRQRFDTAEADRSKARAALAKAQAALAAERDRIAVLDGEAGEIRAALARTEAALDAARIALADTVVRAPVDGVVGNRSVQVGQYARPGAQMLAVVPLPRVHVVANFKETQLARMRPGQTVELTVDAFPDQPLHGTVGSVAPASGAQFSLLPPENATGNFTKIVQRVPVRIEVPADHPLAGLLRPGLSVVASVDTRGGGDRPALVGGVFGAVEPASAQLAARPDAFPQLSLAPAETLR